MSKNSVKVVLVEDTVGTRTLYRDLLENHGYLAFDAENGEEGLTLINNVKPDLILLDLLLPRMNGFEVLKKIRDTESTKNIPVIIISALHSESAKQTALLLGANLYLVKESLSTAQILESVDSFLAARTHLRKK